jgi:hypothetical protein
MVNRSILMEVSMKCKLFTRVATVLLTAAILTYGQSGVKTMIINDDLQNSRAAPKLINYQGYLTDTNGVPVNNPSVSVDFAIYDAASSGNQLWSEAQSSVMVSKGIFNVLLGSITPIPDTVFTKAESRWLQLAVAGQIMNPRTRIVATAYAYTATYADTALYARNMTGDSDWVIVGNNMHSGVPGNVGIGVSPDDSSKLAVRASNMYGGYFSTDNVDGSSHAVHAALISGGDGVAVYGTSATQDGYGFGGFFEGGYTGIYGKVNPTADQYYIGIQGEADGGSGTNFGIRGIASGSGSNYGVYGSAVSGGTTDWAGYFNGDVNITGSLSKGGGSFLIDHPLDPENKTLRHNFVESPENLCMYRGHAKLDDRGTAVITMPDYFIALTKENEATVTLTPIGERPFLVSYQWQGDYSAFRIFGEKQREVSYTVLADRDDPVIHQLYKPVVEEKGNGNFEKGKLLYPRAYGYGEEKGIDYENSKSDLRAKP